MTDSSIVAIAFMTIIAFMTLVVFCIMTLSFIAGYMMFIKSSAMSHDVVIKVSITPVNNNIDHNEKQFNMDKDQFSTMEINLINLLISVFVKEPGQKCDISLYEKYFINYDNIIMYVKNKHNIQLEMGINKIFRKP